MDIVLGVLHPLTGKQNELPNICQSVKWMLFVVYYFWIHDDKLGMQHSGPTTLLQPIKLQNIVHCHYISYEKKNRRWNPIQHIVPCGFHL